MQKLVYNTINQDLLQDGRIKKVASSEQTVKAFVGDSKKPVPKKQPVKITAVASSTPLKTSTPNLDPVVTDDCGCVKMGCCLFVTFGVLVTCFFVTGSKAKKLAKTRIAIYFPLWVSKIVFICIGSTPLSFQNKMLLLLNRSIHYKNPAQNKALA